MSEDFFMFQFRIKVFTKICLALIFSLMICPSKGWSYGPAGIEKTGISIKQFTNRSLNFNVENGPIQDGRGFRTIPNDQVDGFCKANPGGNPPGSGSGGCSLNPFIKEAKAESISSNGEAVNLISEAYGRWKTQAGAFGNTSFIQTTPGAPLADGGDVNLCNANQFIDFTTAITSVDDPRICGCMPTKPANCNSVCNNPIIFDTNGEIIASFGFDPYSVLGVTTLLRVEGATPGNAVGFNMIINGLCLDGSPDQNCPHTYDTNDLKAILTHEAGHSLGLAHSQVNLPINPGLRLANPKDMVTMYPGLYSSEQSKEILDLHLDDLMGYGHLYGPTNPNSVCTVTGTAFNKDGGDGLRCVEIVVRSPANNTTQAVSFISGAEVVNDGVPGYVRNTCTLGGAGCGAFTFQVPVAAQPYQIEVKSLPSAAVGSNIGPCANPPQVNSVEFPNNISTFTCNAGQTVTCTSVVADKNTFGCPQVKVKP